MNAHRDRDGRRMAETRSGSGRSPTSPGRLRHRPTDWPLPSTDPGVTRDDMKGAARDSLIVITLAALCVAGLIYWTWFGGLFDA